MAEVTESQIRQRLSEVIDLIGRHQLALAYLTKEQDELEGAVRVFERFYERPNLSRDLVGSTSEISSPTKPAGIPTVAQMIIAALRESEAIGTYGLEPKAILAFVRTRYWPDAPAASVGPIAWRMWAKENRLQKSGDKYYLPVNETTDSVDDIP
jgi:hypothetical protein